MLNVRLLALLSPLASAAMLAPAVAQEIQPHRAVYAISSLDRGKPGPDVSGTYAFELRLTCDGYAVNQRQRIDAGAGRAAAASEQQSQMTESRDGRKLRFEHRATTSGKQIGLYKGEALIGDDGKGEARFTEPEGQTVALSAGTLFPVAMARETIRQARSGETGFDAQFFFGDKVKPPKSVNIVIGKLPKRLADVRIPEGAEQLADGRTRIYYRAAFFDAQAEGKRQGEPTYEMSSITLDNAVELYSTYEDGDVAIEFRITRLEALPKPECK